MQRRTYILLLFLFVIFCTKAQEDSSFVQEFRHGVNYTVKTSIGSTHTGFVIAETKDYVTFENRITHETIELRKREIVNIKELSDTPNVRQSLWGENLHANNYLISTSAFPFEAGKANTNSHWLFLESINYAFTENWGLYINTIAFYPLTIGVKSAYKISEGNYLGGSALVIGDIGGSGSSPLIGYAGVAKYTRGHSNKNLTVSGGLLGLNSLFFFNSTTTQFTNMGFVSAAYCNRFSKNVAFNLEGWYLPELDAGLTGFGFKFVNDDLICWTVGCYAFLNNYDSSIRLNVRTLPIPYFGVARRFN